MTGFQQAEKIAKAVLYEGYLLYPYTRQAAKNRQRWTFGGIYPEWYAQNSGGSDLSAQKTECLVDGSDAQVSIRLRFLHLIDEGEADGFDAWEEAVERDVYQENISLKSLANRGSIRSHFVFEGFEENANETKRTQNTIQGALEISADRLSESVFRLKVQVSNISEYQTESRSQALLRSMISTHTLLSVGDGEFISLLDPPNDLKAAAEACQNVGTWPVLVGERTQRTMMLSSPIILYDYPEVSPESPGDLFDGAEIDELLSLSILCLTDEEKDRIRREGGRGKELLERTEKLTPGELISLHGRLREIRGSESKVTLRPGLRVRIQPKKISDVYDIALRGKLAVVESIEQDLEGKLHVAVTIEDDPGRDLGKLGQPGHRFFYQADELEPV